MSDLAARAAELAALIPALAAALTRDNAPSGGRPVLSAGCVVNPDVLHAALMLSREVPAAYIAACELTGERWQHRPLDTCLHALPRLHDRLASLGQVSAAKRIEARTERWMRVVKLALGLRVPDEEIGYECPLHDEPAPLVRVGAEGFVQDDRSVTWAHSGVIRCALCGEMWPASRWLMLGRMLATA